MPTPTVNPQPDSHAYVLQSMQLTLDALQQRDPQAMAALTDAATAPADIESQRQTAISQLQSAIANTAQESQPTGQAFHSRVPVAGIIQSHLEASVIPQLQAFAEGNPIVWLPAGIKGILEHCKAKYPFQTATPASNIKIPNTCKIALLADWGADNDHAKFVAAQAMARNPDYMVHLGDIYYSGSVDECNTFLKNWPMKDADGNILADRSFALNGNHEMYSLGKPFFELVLPAFKQEASYFTLSNDFWQFQGLDTAYVPFSISGGTVDSRLQVQWDWLMNSIKSNPGKRNIFLTHNQPVSAHLPEFAAAQALMSEARKILAETKLGTIFGWFFGHEHRCTIYDDDVVSALFKARLIGSGAIGHHPQEETEPVKDDTGAHAQPFVWVNHRSLEDKGLVAVSSFAFLTIEDDKISIEYIDEDGVVSYSESWHASDKVGVGTKAG